MSGSFAVNNYYYRALDDFRTLRFPISILLKDGQKIENIYITRLQEAPGERPIPWDPALRFGGQSVMMVFYRKLGSQIGGTFPLVNISSIEWDQKKYQIRAQRKMKRRKA